MSGPTVQGKSAFVFDAKTPKVKGDPKVYHLVYDRGAYWSQLVALCMELTYKQKFNAKTMDTPTIKRWLTSFLANSLIGEGIKVPVDPDADK